MQDLDVKSVKLWKLSGEHQCKVQKVYDGDTPTIVTAIESEYFAFAVRLVGIDTPEIHPKNKEGDDKLKEHNAAVKARNKLLELLTDQQVILDYEYSEKEMDAIINNNKKVFKMICSNLQDKYSRVLGTLYVPEHVESVNEILIRDGFAKVYYGAHKDTWIFD